VTYMIQDILFHAYQRQSQIGLPYHGKLPSEDYSKLFVMQIPDVSRVDNTAMAQAAQSITNALQTLSTQLPNMSKPLAERAIRMAFQFAGQPIDEDEIQDILDGIDEMRNLRNVGADPGVGPDPGVRPKPGSNQDSQGNLSNALDPIQTQEVQ
jgi:hypothetical protein